MKHTFSGCFYCQSINLLLLAMSLFAWAWVVSPFLPGKQIPICLCRRVSIQPLGGGSHLCGHLPERPAEFRGLLVTSVKPFLPAAVLGWAHCPASPALRDRDRYLAQVIAKRKHPNTLLTQFGWPGTHGSARPEGSPWAPVTLHSPHRPLRLALCCWVSVLYTELPWLGLCVLLSWRGSNGNRSPCHSRPIWRADRAHTALSCNSTLEVEQEFKDIREGIWMWDSSGFFPPKYQSFQMACSQLIWEHFI